MYVVHTVRGSGPSQNFDLSIPFPSFRLAFLLWSTPSRSRVCLPPDPNLLLRLYHQHKNERGKIKIGSAMQRRAIYETIMLIGKQSLVVIGKGQTPESGIRPSERATRRYTKVQLDFCLRFSTLIGQIGCVPLFGAGPRRYITSRLFRLAVTAFWRALTAY